MVFDPESGHRLNVTGAKRLDTLSLRKRLKAEKPTTPTGPVVRHLCGLSWCLEHLAWGTVRDNGLDSRFHRQHGHGHVAPEKWTPEVCAILGLPAPLSSTGGGSVNLYTWEDVDAALDLVEEGDLDRIVAVFLAFRGLPMAPTPQTRYRWTRVTLSSFSKHVGISRHQLDKLVRMNMYNHAKETA